MTQLADDVLGLIRTSRELFYSAAIRHGDQMLEAVAILAGAQPHTDPAEFHSVLNRAIRSAMTVIQRADDSAGVMGDACRGLLALHPGSAAAAGVKPRQLVEWMIKFEFDGPGFFDLDVVDYVPALGADGVELYRRRIQEIAAGLSSPRPSPSDRWRSEHSHEWYLIDKVERRLAVLDRDVDAIIATHARDREVAAWLEDTAKALEEIGEIELAIDWARQAAEFGLGHQSSRAARYWAELVAAHCPAELSAVRKVIVDRWPTARNAVALLETAPEEWPELRPGVEEKLARFPDELMNFHLAMGEPLRALEIAQTNDIHEKHLSPLAQALEPIAPTEALALHEELARRTLSEADASNYRAAAKRLARMRRAAEKAGLLEGVDALILGLREEHRRRPRLQAEFDKAGLPRV